MQRVDREELEKHADEWDAAVERDPDIDPICSRSAWQLSHHDAFAPERALQLSREDGAFVVLAEQGRAGARPIFEPLEPMWGFAAPLMGGKACELLARSLLVRPAAVVLLGLPMDRSRLAPLAELLAGRFGARALEPTTRFVASLESGLEGWLSRRSSAFRRNLRANVRAVREAGIHFRWLESPSLEELPELYAQVLEIEARSWKSLAGNGADRDPMRSFYAGLLPRLATKGQLRVLFAERAGRPVGYLHGALVAGRFRGLQFSFDDRLRDLGLGNVLQLETLQRLCEVGVERYDLGAFSDYKARWGEPGLQTFGLLLQPIDGRGR
jgi:CelD/BcsL family acetyltransferase involved in cellulose biosynthesis